MDDAATFDGAVHDNETDVSPATAATAVGAAGARYGATATGEVNTPLPATFVAAMRNAYVVPLLRPVAVYVVAASAASSVVQDTPPSLDI
jgi:hypothetical protein